MVILSKHPRGYLFYNVNVCRYEWLVQCIDFLTIFSHINKVPDSSHSWIQRFRCHEFKPISIWKLIVFPDVHYFSIPYVLTNVFVDDPRFVVVAPSYVVRIVPYIFSFRMSKIGWYFSLNIFATRLWGFEWNLHTCLSMNGSLKSISVLKPIPLLFLEVLDGVASDKGGWIDHLQKSRILKTLKCFLKI